MARPFARLVMLALVCCLTSAGSVRAAENAASTAANAPSGLFLEWFSGWNSGSSEAAGSYFRIGLDPETGEWGHAPLDRAALGLSSIPAPPLIIHRADGSTEILVDPTWVDYLVARIGPDGRPTFDCAPGWDVRRALDAPVSQGAPDR